MTAQERLVPASALAERNRASFPNESAEYRAARNALLAEEIELRRHAERVAELRRRLPPGGAVSRDYGFVGEGGPVTLAELFGGKDTLAHLQLHVRSAAQGPVPDVHVLHGLLRGQNPRHPAAHLARVRRPLAHRAPGRGQAWPRLDPAPGLCRRRRRLHARLRQRRGRRRRRA